MSTATVRANRIDHGQLLDARHFTDCLEPNVKAPASGTGFTLRSGPALRQLSNSLYRWSGPGGGYTALDVRVADAFEMALIDSSAVRRVASVVRQDLDYDLQWPVLDDSLQEGALVEMGQNAGLQDPAFGARVLRPLKFSSKRVVVSNTVLRDAPMMPTIIATTLGQRISRMQNRVYTVGQFGASGVLYEAQVGKTAASATAFTIDELLDLVASVPDEYAQRGSWMMNRAVWNSCKKLKDGQGNHLWKAAGLDEWPVICNAHMPSALTSGARTVLFGDFSKYQILDVGEARLIEHFENYIETDCVAFEVFMESAGVLLDAGTGPVKALVQG